MHRDWRRISAVMVVVGLYAGCKASPERFLSFRHILGINSSPHHAKRLPPMVFHLLNKLLPINSMHNIFPQHHLHISLQLPTINIPKSSYIVLHLPPIHTRTVILIAIILSLQQTSLQHQHPSCKYIRPVWINNSFVDVLMTYYFALLW